MKKLQRLTLSDLSVEFRLFKIALSVVLFIWIMSVLIEFKIK